MPLLSGQRVSRKTGTARRGHSTVELAVLLPFLLLFALITVDMGRFGKAQIIVTNAAYCGALYASMSPTNQANTSQISSVVNAELQTNNLISSSTTITPTVTPTTDVESYTAVTVTVSVPFSLFYSFATHDINYGGSYTISASCTMRVRQGGSAS
jgi:Flp pilus assembly protein TadG